jgi:peptidoglycan/LPS O-acetylase OafA/YrhL
VFERQQHRAEIQGLRGIAILLVVLYHASVPGVAAGFIGVDVFFVLSGYLITGLLLREQVSTGRLDLTDFFARRLRRLLPAALLVVAVTAAISVVLYPPLEQHAILSAGRAAVLYLVNMWFALRAVDYLGGGAESNPLLHMWSLAVEEQFYFFFPIALALAFARTVKRGGVHERMAWLVASGTALSLLLSLFMTWKSQPWAFFAMPFRAWEFGLGAAVALAAVHIAAWPVAGLTALGIAGTAMLMGTVVFLSDQAAFPGVAALPPTLGVALILVALHSPAPSLLRTLLRHRLLVHLGDVSYSFYLWHWPLLVFVAVLWPQRPPVMTAAALVLAWVASILSLRWIENPIRFHAGLAAQKGRFIAFMSALTVIGALTLTGLIQLGQHWRTPTDARLANVAADIPRVYPDNCHRNFDETDHPACVYGAGDAGTTVVLFGDSHAAQWFPALEGLARTYHWRLIALTKSSCPAYELTVFSTAKRREYFECDVWRERMLQRIVEEKTSLVLIANSSMHYADSDKWARGMRSTLSRLQNAGIAVGVLKDTPWPGFDSPQCLARQAWWGRGANACSFDVAHVRQGALPILRAESEVLRGFPTVLYLDLLDVICPAVRCEVERAGQVLYSDHHHLSASFAATLATPIESRLRQWNLEVGHIRALLLSP